MAIEQIDIETFLELSNEYPVFDVRSPEEFSHAHIPRSHSLYHYLLMIKEKL